MDKRVKEFEVKLQRILKLKKALIDAEMTQVSLKKELNLNFYDWRKLMRGELEEKEAEVWNLINEVPESIRKRDKEMKKFRKILLEKGITPNTLTKDLDITYQKLYKIIRKDFVERDTEKEKAIEKYLGEKVF